IPHGDILRYEELLAVIAEARLIGFTRFRITGGEPLVRKGILWFLEQLASRGVSYSMTTNGLLLARSAADCARAGLRRVNIGLDTLDPATFRRITRSDALADVLRGIDTARASGIEGIKINVVVMRGVNEHEIGRFIEWARRESLDIRFIEFMPVCGDDLFVSLAPHIGRLREHRGVAAACETDGGPARSFRYSEGGGSVGFIMPRTEPFCGACNRLRLTADGTLLPCLFSSEGFDLRGPLRAGAPVAGVIRKAIAAKPRGHELKMRLCRYAMHAVGG
ncbi:MAG: radical SAM protein, partial [Candidatus Aureabacteria bacterium]|nr:radical SAM protein [Candidatus Auribacterota bacterium]